MTREEAKREIQFVKREVVEGSWIDKAYAMAIEALSDDSAKKDMLIGMLKHSSQYNTPCPEWVYKLIEATAYDD